MSISSVSSNTQTQSSVWNAATAIAAPNPALTPVSTGSTGSSSTSGTASTATTASSGTSNPFQALSADLQALLTQLQGGSGTTPAVATQNVASTDPAADPTQASGTAHHHHHHHGGAPGATGPDSDQTGQSLAQAGATQTGAASGNNVTQGGTSDLASALTAAFAS